MNFAAHGKLDLRPKIIHFLVILALEVKKAVGFGIKIWVEPLYLGQKFFWKKPVFWRFRVPWVAKNYRLLIFYLYLWFFDILGTLKAKKTGVSKKNFALNKVAQLQILLPHPTTFLTSRASFRKKWMIFGLRSNIPCAAKFNGRLLF